MTSIDKIKAAEEQVATLQDQLDQVQAMLQKAEEIAAAGEAAKQDHVSRPPSAQS